MDVREAIRAAVAAGASVDEIEAELLAELAHATEEQRCAYWLYAWLEADARRDDRGARFRRLARPRARLDTTQLIASAS